MTAAKTIHRFVSEHDDEWSVSMVAFNEAIEKYTPERGKFSSYAALVIKNRLTDQMRNDCRFRDEISFEPDALEGSDKDGENKDPLAAEIRKKLQEDVRKQEYDPDTQAREEIEAVQKLLGQYGFSFYDLVSCSPKAEKTKRDCALAVIALMKDDELFEKMRRTKSLPAEGIIEASGVKRKILERHRKYIIAAAEILNGEYPLLAGYMDFIRRQIPK